MRVLAWGNIEAVSGARGVIKLLLHSELPASFLLSSLKIDKPSKNNQIFEENFQHEKYNEPTHRKKKFGGNRIYVKRRKQTNKQQKQPTKKQKTLAFPMAKAGTI